MAKDNSKLETLKHECPLHGVCHRDNHICIPVTQTITQEELDSLEF